MVNNAFHLCMKIFSPVSTRLFTIRIRTHIITNPLIFVGLSHTICLCVEWVRTCSFLGTEFFLTTHDINYALWIAERIEWINETNQSSGSMPFCIPKWAYYNTNESNTWLCFKCVFRCWSFQVVNMQCWSSKFCCRPFSETIASIRIWKRMILNCKPILYWNVRKVSKCESNDENRWPRLNWGDNLYIQILGDSRFYTHTHSYATTHIYTEGRTHTHTLTHPLSFALFYIRVSVRAFLFGFVVFYSFLNLIFFLIKWAQCF